MKIVYCHNYYRLRGGEDISFECDLKMLREEGHQVIPFIRENSAINDRQPLRVASGTIWNRSVYREMLELLADERPDILHCNNLFPQISVSVYAAAKKLGIPVVQALRNYRALCSNGVLYRDGQVCTKCVKKSAAWQGIRHGCYRDSRLASSLVVAMQLAHRLMRVQHRFVDAYFTLTHFARDLFVRGGFDPESIFVRSNFVTPDPGPRAKAGEAAVFVGRLSEEKGVASVIQAWSKFSIEIPLIIIGDGPQASSLRSQAENSNIQFTGQLDTATVAKYLSQARLLVMPSLWYETFGRTVAEAFAHGVPVIASRLGAMSELVEDERNGFLFQPGDSQDIATVVKRFLELDAGQVTKMQTMARQTYCSKFSALASYRQLLDVYEFALRKSQSQQLVHEARARIQARLV